MRRASELCRGSGNEEPGRKRSVSKHELERKNNTIASRCGNTVMSTVESADDRLNIRSQTQKLYKKSSPVEVSVLRLDSLV